MCNTCAELEKKIANLEGQLAACKWMLLCVGCPHVAPETKEVKENLDFDIYTAAGMHPTMVSLL